MDSFAEVATELLSNAGVGVKAASDGWSLRYGRMTDEPDTQVVAYDTGGAPAHPVLLLDFPTVMIHIRGPKGEYGGGRTKAQEVKDVLLGITPQVVGGIRIDGILAMGDINLLHYDKLDRPVFSVNFRSFVEPPVSALTNRVPL